MLLKSTHKRLLPLGGGSLRGSYHSLACSFCAAFHLGFCLKGHGLKEWQYDGGSILVAAFLVIKFGLCFE